MTLAILAFGLVLTLAGEATGRFPWRAAGKITASTAMVAFAAERAASGGGPEHVEGGWLLPGFVLHALGDALLLGTGRWFLAGLGAFLVGHIAYAGAFGRLALRHAEPGAPWFAAVVTLVAMAGVITALLRWLGPRMGRMRGAVIAYMATISVMVATAAQAGANLGAALLPVAAVTFALSDVFVARQRFVTPTPVNRFIGLPLYYGAQVLFALSLG